MNDQEKSYYQSMSKTMGKREFIVKRLQQLKSNAKFYGIFLAVIAVAIAVEVVWAVVMHRYGLGSWIATAIGAAALVFIGLHLKNLGQLRREYERELKDLGEERAQPD